MRFILAGSFEQSDKGLTLRLRKVHSVCPTLLDALLPFSERDTDEQMSDISRLSLPSTELDQNQAAIGCLYKKYVQRLGWPLWPGQLEHNDEFSIMLQQAYNIDYGEVNVTFPRTQGLQWCQKLAFTDK